MNQQIKSQWFISKILNIEETYSIMNDFKVEWKLLTQATHLLVDMTQNKMKVKWILKRYIQKNECHFNPEVHNLTASEPSRAMTTTV